MWHGYSQAWSASPTAKDFSGDDLGVTENGLVEVVIQTFENYRSKAYRDSGDGWILPCGMVIRNG